MKESIRKLTKVAGVSYSVVLPKDMVKSLGWKEHQKLVVRKWGKKIVIEDWEEAS